MFKAVSTIMMGTIIAQLINFASSPILTRLYTPADFGLFSIYSGFLTTLGIIMAWRYDTAIILPKLNLQAQYVLRLAVIISVVSFILLYPGLFLIKSFVANKLNDPRIEDITVLIAMGIFIYSLNRSYSFWLTRQKSFKLLAGTRIIYASMTALFSIAFAFIADFDNGLILGALVGVSISLLLVLVLDKTKVRIKFSSKRFISIFYKYRDLPIKNLVPSLMGAIALILPLFFISAFYGIENAGYFGLAIKILLLPATIVAQALSQYLLAEVSELYRKGKKFSDLVLKVIIILTSVSIPFVLILMFWAEPLFSFVFGNDWVKSGTIAQILALSIGVRFISASVSGTLIATYSIGKVSMWQALYFTSTVIVLFIGGYQLDNLTDFLLLYAANDILLYLFYLYLVYSVRNKTIRSK